MADKIYPGVRRAQTRQELDRETWAARNLVSFPVMVNGTGEYLTPEPVMFGRAFEEPPFFNWSGVGEPIAHPVVRAIGWPTGGPNPCHEPLLLGSSILQNPGLESGPEVTLGYLPYPHAVNNTLVTASGQNFDHEGVSLLQSDLDDPVVVVISDENPLAGARHARIDSTEAIYDFKDIYFHSAYFCEVDTTPNHAVRCESGDIVTVGLSAMTDNQWVNGDTFPYVYFTIQFATADGIPISGQSWISSSFTIGLSYAAFSFNRTAPATTYAAYCTASIITGPLGGSWEPVVVDLDSFVVGVG